MLRLIREFIINGIDCKFIVMQNKLIAAVLIIRSRKFISRSNGSSFPFEKLVSRSNGSSYPFEKVIHRPFE